ncbi:hypothetical protein ACFE04_001222 [Oxalis oulophora]
MVFSKILTVTDIDHRLSFPSEHLNCLPSFPEGHNEVDFDAIDDDGKVWRLRCIIRNKEKYLKPVLSAGWKAFVQDKNLSKGDLIEFYSLLDQGEGPKFKIKAKKAVKLFGQIIGHVAGN